MVCKNVECKNDFPKMDVFALHSIMKSYDYRTKFWKIKKQPK